MSSAPYGTPSTLIQRSPGAMPYDGMGAREVHNFVLLGHTLEPPEGTPTIIAKIMKSCWNLNTNLRPSFGDIITQIKRYTAVRSSSSSSSKHHNNRNNNNNTVGGNNDDLPLFSSTPHQHPHPPPHGSLSSSHSSSMSNNQSESVSCSGDHLHGGPGGGDDENDDNISHVEMDIGEYV
eukprot:TRINITY_DN7816_c2_g1_i1.p1 TRINITY_DN7816_c2_g1~~TRINITY_DN7816_c2_g1_i1.p1  ORF type:complete len:209 (+),score=44.07 TRINITY_DN7816_c2_g1_i1:94-627(+)